MSKKEVYTEWSYTKLLGLIIEFRINPDIGEVRWVWILVNGWILKCFTSLIGEKIWKAVSNWRNVLLASSLCSSPEAAWCVGESYLSYITSLTFLITGWICQPEKFQCLATPQSATCSGSLSKVFLKKKSLSKQTFRHASKSASVQG